MELVWDIVAALVFFCLKSILMALYCEVMLKTGPWFSADINTESKSGYVQVTSVYAYVFDIYVYCPFSLPVVR